MIKLVANIVTFADQINYDVKLNFMYSCTFSQK